MPPLLAGAHCVTLCGLHLPACLWPPPPTRCSPQAKDLSHFKDKETGVDLEVQEKMALLEWMANNYKKFGCTLEFITNRYGRGHSTTTC